MILDSPVVDPAEFERQTGWSIKPQGACRGDLCVPLGTIDPHDARALSERLRMPLVHDEKHGLWSLGPQFGGRALVTAEAPDVTLPDRKGAPFELRSLRGQKVFLLAWASW